MANKTIDSLAFELYEELGRTKAINALREGRRDSAIAENYGHIFIDRRDATRYDGPWCCIAGTREYINAFFKDAEDVTVADVLDTLDKTYIPWFDVSTSHIEATTRRSRGGYIYRVLLYVIARHEATCAYAKARGDARRVDQFILGKEYAERLAKVRKLLRLGE